MGRKFADYGGLCEDGNIMFKKDKHDGHFFEGLGDVKSDENGNTSKGNQNEIAKTIREPKGAGVGKG